MKRSLGKLILAGAVIGVVATGVLSAYHRIDPVGYRAVVFQPVREIAYFVRELDAVSGWWDIERIRVPEPETVVITATGSDTTDDGVVITAGVYRPRSSGPAPAVVIQHGSYPWGRKAGLVRLLGSRLAAHGYLVIAPDARGFGDTSDPVDPDDPESWRTAPDLDRVINYLLDTEAVDPANVFVLGHSMGANHALEGGLANPRVKALILVGPGRFIRQEDLRVPKWERARFSADRGLSDPIPVEAALFAYSLGNIRNLAETELAKEDHKPILLIDGEKEGQAKLDYLGEIVRKIEGPVEYETLPDTGHYCGVRSFYGSDTVYYQPRMFDPFFSVLLDFLDRQRLATDASNPDS